MLIVYCLIKGEMDTLEERHTCDETEAQIVVFNTKNDDYLSAMLAIQEHEKAVGTAVEGDHLGADNSISLIQVHCRKFIPFCYLRFT